MRRTRTIPRQSHRGPRPGDGPSSAVETADPRAPTGTADAGRDRHDPARRPATGSGGFSLVEMVIAMTVLTLVMGAVLGLFSSETQALRDGMDRLEVTQNLRFGANAIEKDIKTTGANVPKPQPKLVYADDDVVAFNADFATNTDGPDNNAVYYDPDAPDGEVLALDEDRAIEIPNGDFEYPSTDYTVGDDDTGSPAETLIFFFEEDDSTDRPDDWALYRQVNDQDPRVVSRHVLKAEGSEPFFEYHRLVTPDDAPDRVETVDPADLPLSHDAAIHGSATDDGEIDRIRAVRLRMAATNGETGEDEEVRSVSRMVRIPNMGVERKQVCGAKPNPVAGLTATPEVDDGVSTVLIEWDASVDQEDGEEDVVRYLLWKREASASEWGPPVLALPVGGAEYSYRDSDVDPTQSYEFAIAAQDCTPELSARATAGPVVAPTP